ncbi:MAG: hypothetical protein FWD91_08495, partial [Treponema sp.]|nr:hypothetical protein [Treponema sp.]
MNDFGLRRFFLLAALTTLGCFGWASPLGASEPPPVTRPQRSVPSAETLNRLAVNAPFLPENSLLLLPGALDNPLTQQYIRHNATPGGRASLAAIMRRAGPYLAFIRGKIAYMDLPPELVFLPVIESAYQVT